MKKIILTGGIACGKTEASKIFASLSVPIIDADNIAHDLLKINTPAYHQVVAHFGQSILLSNLEINRALLGQIIFSNPIEKIWLENLLHPLILNKINEEIKQLEQSSAIPAYCIIDIPLYAEIVLSKTNKLKSGFKKIADQVLVIDLDENTQKSRLIERYFKQNIEPDINKIAAILAAQVSRSKRNKLADNIIINNQDLPHLQKNILSLHKHYSDTP